MLVLSFAGQKAMAQEDALPQASQPRMSLPLEDDTPQMESPDFCAVPDATDPTLVKDCNVRNSMFKNMILHLQDAYIWSAKLRDRALDKAKKLIDAANKAEEKRADWERKAKGELGGLGRNLPDWTKVQESCANTLGETACALRALGQERFTDMVHTEMRSFRSTLIWMETDIDKNIGKLMGTASELLASTIRDGENHYLFQQQALLKAQAANSLRLCDYSRAVTQQLDSLYSNENLANSVSSGRARQLAAQVAILESEVESKIAVQKIMNLRTAAIDAAQNVIEQRQLRHAVATASRSF